MLNSAIKCSINQIKTTQHSKHIQNMVCCTDFVFINFFISCFVIKIQVLNCSSCNAIEKQVVIAKRALIYVIDNL